MNRIKILTIVAVIAIIAAQCTHKEGGSFTVTVHFKNADKVPSQPVRLLLQEIPYGADNRPVLLDSGTVQGKTGKLTLKGNGREQGIYELQVQNGPSLLLVNDEAEIDVNIDLGKNDDFYAVTGSPASSELKSFIETYGNKSILVNQAFEELDSLKQNGGSDSLLLAVTAKKNSAIKELNTYMGSFISTSIHPAVSFFALGMSSRVFQQVDFQRILNQTVQKFPEHKMLASLKANYDMQQAQLEKQEEAGVNSGKWVGKPAPDLSMPSPKGDMISISSFRGKYVLVDFWASWCGPCRAENPNVVKAYNQYKNKNFTVLGVSLDKDKEAWLSAIKEDKLDWPQMSDLDFWNSNAVSVYGFDGIPYNVLVDPQGIVIAEGLRGFDLEKKLSEVLK